MSKTQMVRIFNMIFIFLYSIMIMIGKTKEEEKEAYILISDAQKLMDEIAND